MRIKEMKIKNFRLLKDVNISLEDSTTVIVGRNNSGKTSVTEIFRRILSGDSPKFYLEDFSLSAHDCFWNAYGQKISGEDDDAIRDTLPIIEVKLSIQYDAEAQDLGFLSEFIIDLDTDTTHSEILIQYQLADGKINAFFENIIDVPDNDEKKKRFFKEIKERIPKYFNTAIYAIDPTDGNNQKKSELSKLKQLLQTGFINAQRKLDDTTDKEKDVLGKLLEKIFKNASSENAENDDKAIVAELGIAVNSVQNIINENFSSKLDRLLPSLLILGYPGFCDSELQTETNLHVEKLLTNNTIIKYASQNGGICLPETYNGLGSRNLIFIMFQLFQFFKEYRSRTELSGVQLIFIEEPEAHLHPQMQEVFIGKLNAIINDFSTRLNNGNAWPVQFIITTHSTHIANEAPFESIRYFMRPRNGEVLSTVKDFKTELSGDNWNENKEFLHKYLTLTRCDLFFADKAILIEGAAERLLMKEMIKKSAPNLSSQYITTLEVGGAYAHKFFEFLNFLELPSLIITDIDSVEGPQNKKCKVAEGEKTSNACLKKWFNNSNISPEILIGKNNADKIIDMKRIAYQIPETGSTACGRSFEDAFMLANSTAFEITGDLDTEKANIAYEKAADVNKTDFALNHAIISTEWQVPLYIKEGLKWLETLSNEVNANLPGEDQNV